MTNLVSGMSGRYIIALPNTTICLLIVGVVETIGTLCKGFDY